MTTVQLKTYRINCDDIWQPELCTKQITIHEVESEYEAKDMAKKLGWRVELGASCPACEAIYQEQKNNV